MKIPSNPEYFRSFTRSTATILLLAVVLLIVGRHAHAAERLALERGALDPDRTFIESFAKPLFTHDRQPYSASYVYVGRHDIDGDGEAELVVFIAAFNSCGVVGCPMKVFKRAGHEWLEFLELTATSDDDSSKGALLYAVREKSHPYLTIFSTYEGWRWNGTRYEYMCLRDCDHTEGNEALKEFFNKRGVPTKP